MRVKTFFRVMRILSTITLFFFVWTFLPAWQIAAWAVEQPKTSKAQKETPKPASAGEQFETELEALRERVGKTHEKAARDEDVSEEIIEIKLGTTRLTDVAGDIRAELAATEKKIAGLPNEIKERHRRFTAHFEDNLRTLKANLADTETAKTKTDRKAKIEKARLHLDKVKKPSTHQKLDPNNLPFRARTAAKTREPRTTRGQFEKDFPKHNKNKSNLTAENAEGAEKDFIARSHEQRAMSHSPQRTQSSPRTAGIWDADERGKGGLKKQLSREWTRIASKTPSRLTPNASPVLLAYNGPADGMPFQLPLPTAGEGWGEGTIPQVAFTESVPFLLAQAADTPSPEDLGETPEIQFTDAIRAKAQELGCAPARLYTWTRNSIEFVPTYGSIQGANMCLQTKQCNSFDTNALLAALFRSCNIPARFVIGTIEVPIEKIMNWAGGFSDPVSALNYIASGGIPITGLRSGGKIYAARLETVWLRVFVDYIPSYGAVHKEGDTFIPLDASYKQYTYTDGVDLQAAVPFDGQNLADQIKATATINEQESYVTNVDPTLIQTALTDYNAQLDNYVTQNLPDATPDDILGKKQIIKKEQPILPASLPYKIIVTGTETTEIPDSMRHKVTIQLTNADSFGDNVFTYTTSLPQIAGKRLSLSYDPATTADQDTINRYVEEYATNIPAYLIQFRPVLKIENTIVATGASVGMGSAQNLSISLISPRGTEMVTHNLLAGDYTAIGINPSTISLDALNNRVNKNDFSEPVGEMLHQTALSYWAEADAFNSVIAKTMRVNNFRHPSELSASAKVSITYVWGVPGSATYSRRNIDVKFDNQTVFSKTSDKTNESNYMQQSGTNSSFLEGAIMDQLFGGSIGDSISAVTVMQLANEQGIPIYKINSGNVGTILPKLQLSNDVKTDVMNAVNAGLQVQIPQSNVTKSAWTGVGYIALNTTDGTGAYRISGGLNGGDNPTGGDTVIPLPPVPIVGAITYVVQGFSANSGSNAQVMRTTAGTLIGIRIAGAAVVAAKLLLAIILAVLIIGAIQYLMDKLPPRYEKFRKYTTVYYAMKDWTERKIDTIYTGFFEGDLIWPGIYITDLRTEPITLQDRIDIATILRIPNPKYGPPDPTKVEAYIDLLIDKNRVGLISCQFIYPHQFLYPHIPMWEDGVKIIFTGIGPSSSY